MTPISIKYEEMSQGPAHHPLRLTINHTDASYTDSISNGYEWPGSHAGDVHTHAVPPEGAWWRLNSNFNAAGYSQINQNIINTLKTYGAIIADNGSAGLTGNWNPSWNDSDLHNLNIHLSDGVFIDVIPYCANSNTYQTNGSGTGPLSVAGAPGDSAGGAATAAAVFTHHSKSQARAHF